VTLGQINGYSGLCLYSGKKKLSPPLPLQWTQSASLPLPTAEQMRKIKERKGNEVLCNEWASRVPATAKINEVKINGI
jgi:hypothetical protein